MYRLNSRILLVLIVLAVLGSAARRSDAGSVAYIHQTGNSVDYLVAYGHTVTYFEDPLGLSLAGLAGFDTVLVNSNNPFSEPVNIGNVLGQFADAGGTVVAGQFSFQGHWALGGTLMAPGYSPFTVDPLSSGYTLAGVLGTIHAPGSPLLAGLVTANVQTPHQGILQVDPGATLVADWDSGRPAVAYRVRPGGGTIVGLNVFPGLPGLTTDTEHLVANAVGFSGAAVVPLPSPLGLLALGLGLLGLRSVRSRAYRSGLPSRHKIDQPTHPGVGRGGPKCRQSGR